MRAALLAGGLLLLAAGSVPAQEYSRFLTCGGVVTTAQGETRDANADFALRYSGRRALVQRSNVLPAGEVMDYVPTPANYSMVYRLAPVGVRVLTLPGWLQTSALVFLPNLQRLNQVRLSINRQTGELQGTLLNEQDEVLATLSMDCASRSEEELGAPKF